MAKALKWTLITALGAALFAAGYFTAGPRIRGRSFISDRSRDREAAPAESESVFWTCSMHPQIRQPKEGKCPLCAMDLIPVSSGSGDEGSPGAPVLTLSPAARALAGIEVTTVKRQFIRTDIRLSGKLALDETRLASITARTAGRIDRLFVNFTGTRVNKGEHMALLYSPELVTAQNELIEAGKRHREQPGTGSDFLKDSARVFYDSSREKLRLLGLTPDQISEIETSGIPSDHLTIYAPLSGIVISKSAREGMYVETGEEIYAIADMSLLWAVLDAYESDLPFLKYAQSVRISTEAYPGEFFEGRIAFIHPVLNEATRTVRVRVNIPNGEGRLKPGMLIRAMITPEIGDRGVVLAPDLAGKWISPMHPEIIRDEPGNCDVCGMPLVRAEELGLVTNQKDITPPLVIPASAALLTGKRAVVYVEKAGDDGTYEGREAALGPRVGDHYVVLEGLTEGDRVVTRGNFRIDSELQIRARPSMMSRQTGDDEDGAADHSEHTNSTDETAIRRFEDIPGEFTAGLSKVYAAYYRIQQALASDDIERAKEAAGELTASLDKVPASLLSSDAKNTWSRDSVRAARLAGELAASATMEDARARFRSITDVILQTAHGFGNPGEKPMIRFFCPMAFNNQGAQWLQDHSGVENPYFGAMMYRCGEELEAVGGDK